MHDLRRWLVPGTSIALLAIAWAALLGTVLSYIAFQVISPSVGVPSWWPRAVIMPWPKSLLTGLFVGMAAFLFIVAIARLLAAPRLIWTAVPLGTVGWWVLSMWLFLAVNPSTPVSNAALLVRGRTGIGITAVVFACIGAYFGMLAERKAAARRLKLPAACA